MQYQTIKIRRDTHRLLKIAAAETGETMLDLIDRLVKADRENRNVATNVARAENDRSKTAS